ncbi:glutathione peroxidase [Leuconostocaceae bacterium ESL0723]|nr:glutathione peroxidase [Lactobacillaceae bacterium L1_55_11]WEV54233.1 glutathione peroxidase [Leuconostocaceae bacterium ESL0723]
MTSIYDFTETEVSGQKLDLKDYEGKVVLIVNTASKCGLAPQLEGLEELYKKYHEDGLEVLGLPSNQFKQELDTGEEASEYCQMHYGVTFPMTERIHVNGKETDPLFVYLKKESGSGTIKWNYTKFLIGRNGEFIHRYAPMTTPDKIEPDIVKALEA